MSVFSACRVMGVASALCAVSVQVLGAPPAADAKPQRGERVVQVAGDGVDLVSGAIIHSKTNTPTGTIQKSTGSVELNGDLHGRVLFETTSIFDSAKNTLVNTGDQVYSGTIAGSEPAMIHDSQFRFEVNLTTGADSGSVYLLDHIAGPRVRCTLRVVGTGKNADGNPTFNYTGECRFANQAPAAPVS
jgi:hypothetical protein